MLNLNHDPLPYGRRCVSLLYTFIHSFFALASPERATEIELNVGSEYFNCKHLILFFCVSILLVLLLFCFVYLAFAMSTIFFH